MNLHEYFLNNNQRLIHKWIHYFDVYERHFRRFVDKEMLIIEIGVFEGGSIEMWKEYFGEKATVVGIDINPNCKQFEDASRNIFVEIGSQSDPEFLKSIIEKYGRPDILLDDGSHKMSDVVTSFENLYYQVKDDGVCVLCTSSRIIVSKPAKYLRTCAAVNCRLFLFLRLSKTVSVTIETALW